MPTAGTQITVFRPKIYVAPVGTVLPAISLALGGTWPTGWNQIPHTEEGAVITPSAPKDDIVSDEAGGPIAVVPAGGAEINISFTAITPDLDLFEWLSSFTRTTVAAVVAPAPAFPAYKRLSLSAEGRQFMIGLEGEVQEGGLLAEGGFVRAFGYKVEQTDEVEINMRRTGEDSALRVAANVRCLNTEVTTTQKASTGITSTDSRFDMFVVENSP
jgi:hypothetical protein